MDVLSVTLGDLKEAENDYQFALLAGEDAAKGQKKIYDEKKALYDTELASLNNIIEAQDINVENQKAYSETIKQIDEARVAAQEGNYEKALGIMSTYETGLKNAHTGTLSELKTQYQETQTSYTTNGKGQRY